MPPAAPPGPAKEGLKVGLAAVAVVAFVAVAFFVLLWLLPPL